ncbi:MAG: TVP38/TMEM64 family protein [Myxococcota bacterium]
MDTEARPEQTERWSRTRAIAVGGVVVGVAIALSQTVPLMEWMANFDAYVTELGPTGPLVYAAGSAVGVTIFLPAIPLAIGAGALFGFWMGCLVALVATTSGATLSFLLARTLLRKQVEEMTRGRRSFNALDQAITRSGARIVFLTRLAPIFPFSIINLAYGVTGIRTRAYVPSTAVGIVPTMVACAYLGATAADVASTEEAQIRSGLQIAGAIASVIVAVLLARFAKKAIREAGVEG